MPVKVTKQEILDGSLFSDTMETIVGRIADEMK
jgi:hypothetical protein